MLLPYFLLSLAALLPVVFAIGFYVLEKKSKFSSLNYWVKQVIFGIVFGGIAVLGTEWGIKVDGAAINCRDAAVIISGLMFGGPSGIIAGLIGGIERWFSVYWGVGEFTRVACSVSTILAGFFSAGLRKWVFKNNRPNFVISFAIGFVVEVFHFLMVFITNINESEKAMRVLSLCVPPMTIANGLSVLLASLSIYLLGRFWDKSIAKQRKLTISRRIQAWLLIANFISVLATSLFTYRIQDGISSRQCDSNLTQALNDTENDIKDETNAFMIDRANLISNKYKIGETVILLATEYNVAEINVVNSLGIIVDSNISSFIGFDMNSGEQSKQFLCLLDKEEYYVQDYGPTTNDPNVYRKYAGIKYDDGFIQIGYDAEQFQTVASNEMKGITKNRHVGNTGFIIIIDSAYNVISAPEGFKYTNLGGSIDSNKIDDENLVFTATLNEENYFVKYRVTEGYFIVSMITCNEVSSVKEVVLYVNTLTEILAFAILFALIYLLLNKLVVKKVINVNDSLNQITNGNLDVQVNEHGTIELDSLSNNINKTVDALKHLIEEEKMRMAKELELARTIQTSALPTNFDIKNRFNSFDIFASMDPAKEVGGDFYDFYISGNNAISILIADVSGKGVPAALFMMKAKTELKALTENGLPLDEVFNTANKMLYDGNDANMFITAWQANIDLDTGLMRYVNAGHNKPLIKKKDGTFAFIEGKVAFVLAGLEFTKYKVQEITLEEGDGVYLYTDGVTEATNIDNELYGDKRLLDVLNREKYSSMEQLCKAVKNDVDNFYQGREQFDDITMLGFKFTKKANE